MNGIFDSHAHYDSERFLEDQDSVINEIFNNGVANVINVGCDIESSINSIELAKKYKHFYASVGIHPHEASNVTDDYLEQLEKFTKDDKVIAIGEIGLDYFYDLSDRESQKKVFEQQLKLAQKLDLPIIIHSRDAVQDTMELLSKYKLRGVQHCFTGSAETAKEVVKLGMYIGFTGVVTFQNARKTLEVIEATPLDRILLETDCPYMAPVPFRGQRTTSDMIEKTAETIAKIKGIDTQELINIASNNTKTLFKIDEV